MICATNESQQTPFDFRSSTFCSSFFAHGQAEADIMKVCSVDGCGRKYYSIGYCVGHYAQIKKRGRIANNTIKLIRKKGTFQKCKVMRCDKNMCALGYCKAHYEQSNKYGKIVSIELQKKYKGIPCIVKDCGKKVHSKGYCNKHYSQLRQYGRIIDSEIDRTKRGLDGCFIRKHRDWTPENTEDGYVDNRGRFRVYLPLHPRSFEDGYVLRAIIHYEYFNSEIVTKEFDIHHKDKNRLNDTKDNLSKILHSKHSKLHNPQRRIGRVCIVCKKNFEITPSRLEHRRGKYCSLVCRYKENQEKKTSG